MSDANGKGERFWALHQQSTPFLLPNAWDPGSARMLEAGGAQAIGTTSAGQAFSLARTDGAASSEQVLKGSADIAAAVSVPLAYGGLDPFTDEIMHVEVRLTSRNPDDLLISVGPSIVYSVGSNEDALRFINQEPVLTQEIDCVVVRRCSN